MAAATPPPSSTTVSLDDKKAERANDTLNMNDAGLQNWLRAGRAVDEATAALCEVVAAGVDSFHKQLVTQLGDLPACQEHNRKPGEPRVKASAFKKCEACKPWLTALAAAHASGKADNLNTANLYPSQWRDPEAGPWSIATAFTRAGSADSPAHADATCLANILTHFSGAFPTLTDDDQQHLRQLLTVRNTLAHLRPKQLPTDKAHEYIGQCLALLQSGPWTKPPFATATLEAVERVVAWRDRPMELLPLLEELKPHYVRQRQPLEWLSQALKEHRIVALSGLGGVGKSTTALAFAWQQARSGKFPGRHGVLWLRAGGDSGGMAAGLANVVTVQLGMYMTATEAGDDAKVRQRLQGWASKAATPWLLVVDNLEPHTKEEHLGSLLGAHGRALVTSRAGAAALYRDVGIPRAAVLSLQCLGVKDALQLTRARYEAACATPTPLTADEEAALQELCGVDMLGGLPLALEQVAALVGATPGMSFASYVEQYKRVAPAGVAARLPGDDGGAGDSQDALSQALTAALRECGLLEMPGLLTWLMQECESLDDVQWLQAEDVQWGGATPQQQPTTVQRRKWTRFAKLCKEHSASTRQSATVATVWTTQLAVLPPHCVELLRAASCFAPEHIPQVLFERALAKWVEDGGGEEEEEEEEEGFTKESALAAEVRKLGGKEGGAKEVVEAALQRLENVSLLSRGVWHSAGQIHPTLAAGVLGDSMANASSGPAASAATGGAGSGAGAGGGTAGSSPSWPWFTMHRLVQGAVQGQSPEALECGLHTLAAVKTDVDTGFGAMQSLLDGFRFAGTVASHIGLTAWLAAYGHGIQAARVLFQTASATVPAGQQRDSQLQCIKTIETLSRLIKMLALFGQGSAWVAALESTSAAMKVLHEGKDHHDVATSLNHLANVHYSCSNFAASEPLYLEALAIHRRVAKEGEDNPDVALLLSNLGNQYRMQSRYAEAEPLLEEALDMELRRAARDDESSGDGVPRVLGSLANLYMAQSRYSEALSVHATVVQIRHREANGGDSDSLAASLQNLGLAYNELDRFAEATALCTQSLEMYRRLHGDGDSIAMAGALNNVAHLYYTQAKLAEAEPLYVQVLEMTQRLHGDGDSREVAGALRNLANAYQSQGQYSKAEAMHLRAYSMYLRLYGESDHTDVAGSLKNLSQLYRAQTRFAEAEPLAVAALEMRQRLHGGKDATAVASSLKAVADLYEAQSRYAEAQPLMGAALAMYQRLHGGNNNTAVTFTLASLASLCTKQSRFEEALELYTAALAATRQLHGDSDGGHVAAALSNVGYGHLRLSHFADAERCFVESLEMQQRLLGNTDSIHLAIAMNNVAAARKALSRYAEAEPLYVQCLAMQQRLAGGRDTWGAALGMDRLGTLCRLRSKLAPAQSLHEKCLAMRQRMYKGKDHSDVAASLHNLADVCKAQSRLGEAEGLYVKALAMERRVHGDSDSSDVARVTHNLAELYMVQGRTEEAEALHEAALAMRQRLHKSKAHVDVAESLRAVGGVRTVQGRLAEAETLLGEALASVGKLCSGNSSEQASVLAALGELRVSQGLWKEAQEAAGKALKMWEGVHGSDSDSCDVVASLLLLGRAQLGAGRVGEAGAAFDRCLAMGRRLHGCEEPHVDVAAALRCCADVFMASKREGEAAVALAEAARMYKALDLPKER